MTEKQITDLVEAARAHGREFSRFDASMYLQAREVVARGPGGEFFEVASRTVANFSRYLTTGVRCDSFEMFELPIPQSDEEKARFKEAQQPKA